MIFEKGSRTKDNILFWKLYYRHRDMMSRCYKHTCKSYKDYGGRGVAVCEKWKSLDGFLGDVDKVEGFTVEGILDGTLTLDKDKKGTGKLYSLENCTFITRSENTKIANTGRWGSRKTNFNIYGISPEGHTYLVEDRKKFVEEYNLKYWGISASLNRNIKHYGWVFYKEEK